MRKLLGFIGLLTVFVLVLAASPVSAGPPVQTVATGSFTLLGPAFGYPAGSNRTFAFSAHQSSDGTVTGQEQSRSFSGNISHGNITCFVRDGNQAIVGGVYTEFSQDPSFVGTNFAFAIQDNPDVSTFVFFGFDNPGDNPCEDLLPAAGEPDISSLLNDYGIPVTTGNIMIAP